MRKISLIVVAGAVAAALAACSKESPDVKIGHAAPLTGGIAHLGKDNENGARLAVEEANGKGIKIGGKAVKFELQGEDDQADPKLGPTIAQKFADAKILSDVLAEHRPILGLVDVPALVWRPPCNPGDPRVHLVPQRRQGENQLPA